MNAEKLSAMTPEQWIVQCSKHVRNFTWLRNVVLMLIGSCTYSVWRTLHNSSLWPAFWLNLATLMMNLTTLHFVARQLHRWQKLRSLWQEFIGKNRELHEALLVNHQLKNTLTIEGEIHEKAE